MNSKIAPPRLRRSFLRIAWSGAGIACAGVAFATALPTATSANPPSRAFAALPQTRIPATLRNVRRGRMTAPAPCTTNYPGASFVGIAGQRDIAAGEDSAVLGGYSNNACAEFSGVGTGYLNSANVAGSFVGGGGYVTYADGHAFGNQASGQDAFVGAGDVNSAYGDGSFVGAGGVYYEGLGSGFSPGNAAGGTDSFVGAGDINGVAADLAFIGNGYDNTIASTGYESVIVGGADNLINASGVFVGGGSGNDATATGGVIGGGADNNENGSYGVVAGGHGNVAGGAGAFVGAGGSASHGNSASGVDAFAGAGDQNSAAGTESFVGGGSGNVSSGNFGFLGAGINNTVAQEATYGALLGGNKNNVGAQYAVVLGGYANYASAPYAVIAGGDQNAASGTLSFAAGYNADAVHNGSFVWSDYSSGSALAKDTASNQFVVRASGGVTLYSNEAMSAGVSLPAGSGTWTSLSDRNAKTAIEPLDDASVLAKVTALPVSTWRYKTESGVRHVGPMAQDFYAAFGVGEDSRHITSIDEDGVALAAIKALASKIGKLEGENAQLRARLTAVESKVARH